jgi:hypothetical protein
MATGLELACVDWISPTSMSCLLWSIERWSVDPRVQEADEHCAVLKLGFLQAAAAL